VEQQVNPEPAPEAAQSEAAESSADELADLRRELAAARAQAEQHLAAWQRSAADFANFKRRVDDEKQYVERWLLLDLLPLADEFERAWAALPRELRNLSWIEGVWQVHQKLRLVLERHGVAPIEAEGKSFDPVEHEAVLREEGLDPAEPTAVVAELQRGYRLHERVLRAALVKVGRPGGV
jgi:molecular chaperone GrpE